MLILTTLPTSVADYIWMQLLQYTFRCLMVTLCFSTLTGDYIESQLKKKGVIKQIEAHCPPQTQTLYLSRWQKILRGSST